jgi:membrane protease YdiL (CAAX protease family)
MVRRIALGWQAFAVFLVIWGNAAAYLAGSAIPTGWGGAALGLALAGITLAWARAQRLTRDELGLVTERLGRGAFIGVVFALVTAGVGLVLLRYPPVFGEAITYAPLVTAGITDIFFRTGVTMPLDTVVPEELAFRGALLAALMRRFAPVPALLWSAGAFAAWHLVIVRATLLQTNLVLDPVFGALGAIGAFAAVFGGGIAFALLRLWTKSLAAPMVAHWAFNSALLFGMGRLI